MYVWLWLYILSFTLTLVLPDHTPSNIYSFPAYRFYPNLLKRNFIRTFIKKSALKEISHSSLHEDEDSRAVDRGTFWSRRKRSPVTPSELSEERSDPRGSRGTFWSKRSGLPFSSIIRFPKSKFLWLIFKANTFTRRKSKDPKNFISSKHKKSLPFSSIIRKPPERKRSFPFSSIVRRPKESKRSYPFSSIVRAPRQKKSGLPFSSIIRTTKSNIVEDEWSDDNAFHRQQKSF